MIHSIHLISSCYLYTPFSLAPFHWEGEEGAGKGEEGKGEGGRGGRRRRRRTK